MRLKKEVSNFSASCEHLLYEAETSGRELTGEEALLVEYYCREVLKKVVKRPPSQPEGSSSGSQHLTIPPSDPKQQAIGPPTFRLPKI